MKADSRAGEVMGSAKCLAYGNEDPSFISRTHVEQARGGGMYTL